MARSAHDTVWYFIWYCQLALVFLAVIVICFVFWLSAFADRSGMAILHSCTLAHVTYVLCKLWSGAAINEADLGYPRQVSIIQITHFVLTDDSVQTSRYKKRSRLLYCTFIFLTVGILLITAFRWTELTFGDDLPSPSWLMSDLAWKRWGNLSTCY